MTTRHPSASAPRAAAPRPGPAADAPAADARITGGLAVRDGEPYGDVFLSIQAGRARRSRPRAAAPAAVDDIRLFTHLEVAIIGRDDALTRPASLGLSRAADRLFDADDIAGPVGWSDVNRLRRELIARHQRLLRRR
jgi:hypothetical protein